MTDKETIGKLGEEAACRYLAKRGYKIIARNLWKPWGELDIVTMAPDKTLVFAEVKTVTGPISDHKPSISENQRVSPEDQMTAAKIRKFKKAASLYAGSHQELIKDKKGWRLDLVAVILPANEENSELTDVLKNCVIKHYENIA